MRLHFLEAVLRENRLRDSDGGVQGLYRNVPLADLMCQFDGEQILCGDGEAEK